MSDKINLFLDSVCSHIKYKPVHQEIRDELTSHVMELKEEFIEETQDEETALDMAISAMGDCGKIGKCLNKQHRAETEWSLIGLTAIIAIIGGIVMYSSSFFESTQAVDFKRYLIFAVLGFAVMVGLYFFNYTKLKRLAWPLYLLSLALLFMTIWQRNVINGASRFIWIGGLLISTDFTTPLFLIAFVGFIDNARYKGGIAILKLSALASVPVFLIIMQPKLSQAFTLSIGYAVLITTAIIKNHFGGSRKRQLIFLGSIAGFAGFLFSRFLFSAPYRIARLSQWVSTFISRGKADPVGMGYQQVMADKWLMASNLFGTTSKKIHGQGFDSLIPCVTTDYAFVNVIATLGWIIGLALILTIAVYICRMFITTRKIKNDYGFYISLAACTVLAVQFVTGILVNFNFLPPTSVYIPFISYGGVGYVVSMALVGLILSVWRRNNLIPALTKNMSSQA